MAFTYEPIATTTLSSAASSITFSSISSAYTDLRLVLVGTVTTNGANYFLQLNSDSASNYSQTYLYGSGTAAVSGRGTAQTVGVYLTTGFSPSSTIPTMTETDIFSYSNSSTNKTVLSSASGDLNGSGYVSRLVGLWRNTAAITSVAFVCNTST